MSVQPTFLHCIVQNIFSKSYIWNFDKTPLICWCHKHPLLLQPRYKTQWSKLGVIKAIRKTHGQRGDRKMFWFWWYCGDNGDHVVMWWWCGDDVVIMVMMWWWCDHVLMSKMNEAPVISIPDDRYQKSITSCLSSTEKKMISLPMMLISKAPLALAQRSQATWSDPRQLLLVHWH